MKGAGPRSAKERQREAPKQKEGRPKYGKKKQRAKAEAAPKAPWSPRFEVGNAGREGRKSQDDGVSENPEGRGVA